MRYFFRFFKDFIVVFSQNSAYVDLNFFVDRIGCEEALNTYKLLVEFFL